MTINRSINVATTITLADLKADAGVSGTRWELVTGSYKDPWPPGMTGTKAGGLTGTPTTAGTYPTLLEDWNDGSEARATVAITAPAVTIPPPEATATPTGYVLPDAVGARWTVGGVVTPPGLYTVAPVTETTTVSILPEALDGYVFDPAPAPLVLTWEPVPEDSRLTAELLATVGTPALFNVAGTMGSDTPTLTTGTIPPGLAWDGSTLYGVPSESYTGDLRFTAPKPDGAHVILDLSVTVSDNPEDPWELLDEDPDAARIVAALSPRVLRLVDDADGDSALAGTGVAVVLEYVKGYTRGRGFRSGIPERDVQAVIVAASARLYTNPEQVTTYTAGDYSERPAVLAGWTTAELGVLHRHRRRQA